MAGRREQGRLGPVRWFMPRLWGQWLLREATGYSDTRCTKQDVEQSGDMRHPWLVAAGLELIGGLS